MCGDNPRLTYERILADDLVRLVMASDGVSEAELRIVLEDARRAVLTRGRRRPAQTQCQPAQCQPARAAISAEVTPAIW